MADLLEKLIFRSRKLLRACGLDVVRYRPAANWPTLLGVERLPVQTVLDIGAFDGDTARIFLDYFPQAAIHCFEPQPKPYQELVAGVAREKRSVYCYLFALGDQPGKSELFVAPGRLRVSSFLERPARTDYPIPDVGTHKKTVEVYWLDDVDWQMDLRDDILVKIDTEGFEKHVITGGRKVLRRADAPTIVECDFEQIQGNF